MNWESQNVCISAVAQKQSQKDRPQGFSAEPTSGWMNSLGLFLAAIYDNIVRIKESRQEGTIAPSHKVLGISSLAALPAELVPVQIFRTLECNLVLLGDL